MKEAYGIYPGGNANAPTTSLLDAKVGIVLNADDSNLSLDKQSANVFRTTRKMSAREKFKLQVTNNIECYIMTENALSSTKYDELSMIVKNEMFSNE